MAELAGIIYGLRCTCHNDTYRYIGKSVTSASVRLRSHKYNARRGIDLPIYKWMRKHGPKNIVSDTLDTCLTKDALNRSEQNLIVEWGTHVSNPGGLNVTRGGDGSSVRRAGRHGAVSSVLDQSTQAIVPFV